ncbi:MAG: repeat containing protein [Cyanobacteria bacterium RYN_339]|nr:repeat containing protein [Cyanobacteria bacterium RYN_339]
MLVACSTPTKPVTGRKPLEQGPVLVTAATALTGKVKLVSDHGGGVISNNSGNLISNNGGAIIANNSGGLTGKTKYAVQDDEPGEYFLADAVVEVVDAAGNPVLDAAGKALVATTDATGSYRFTAVPGKNAVLRIKLHAGGLLHGGELSALKTPAVASLPIDTASALGTAYVLGKYVQGQQSALDKLPTAEAQRLHDDLDAARALLGRVPSYAPADLVAATEELRGKAPAVAKTLEAIRALLLGQAFLGDGRQANGVAIFDPVGLVPLPDGGVLIAEAGMGRIRKVSSTGTISTYADVVRGQVKQNFRPTQDMARMPDGSVLVATNQTIFKLTAEGKVSIFAGTGEAKAPGAVDVPATTTPIYPRRLAVAADGTVYVAESTWVQPTDPGRLLSITPDGVLHRIPIDVGTAHGGFLGLALGPDGELDVLWTLDTGAASLYRYRPGKGTVLVADAIADASGAKPDLARAENGTLYVSDPGRKRIVAITPDGKQGAPAGIGADLVAPSGLAVDANGALLVCDAATNLVHALTPAGAWSVRAGVDESLPIDPNALPLNAPATCAFAPNGDLLITESASHAIRRFSGGLLTTVAGGTAGFAGDGGPVAGLQMKLPSGLAFRGKEIIFTDLGNGRIRAIGEDGIVHTLVGGGVNPKLQFKAGERLPATEAKVTGSGLAVDARGRIYWSTLDNQVMRLAEDGMVELVCGVGHTDNVGQADSLALSVILNPVEGVSALTGVLSDPQGLAFDRQGNLLVADTISGKIHKITGLDGPDPRLEALAGKATAAWIGQIPEDGTLPIDHIAREATIVMPAGVAVDAAGNVYLGEMGTVGIPLIAGLEGGLREGVTQNLPRTYARIRKITPDGTITTLAGPGGKFFPDPNAEDGLVLPIGIDIAADGRMAILDPGANLVRILPAGSY